MKARLKTMTSWALAVTIVAVLAIVVTLTLELFSDRHIPIHLFVCFAAFAVGGSIGLIAIMCTRVIFSFIEEQMSARDEQFNGHVATIVESLEGFAGAVRDFSDQNVTEARLEVLKSLSQNTAVSDSDRSVTPIRRREAR